MKETIVINKSTPILHVESVEPGVNFWTERFGFKKTIEVPEGDHGLVAFVDRIAPEIHKSVGLGSDILSKTP